MGETLNAVLIDSVQREDVWVIAETYETLAQAMAADSVERREKTSRERERYWCDKRKDGKYTIGNHVGPQEPGRVVILKEI